MGKTLGEVEASLAGKSAVISGSTSSRLEVGKMLYIYVPIKVHIYVYRYIYLYACICAYDSLSVWKIGPYIR
jgi:hypothetical protein